MAINRDKSLFFRIENPRVGGSIPPLATMKFRYLFWVFPNYGGTINQEQSTLTRVL